MGVMGLAAVQLAFGDLVASALIGLVKNSSGFKESKSTNGFASVPKGGSVAQMGSVSSIKIGSVQSTGAVIEDEIRAVLLQKPQVTTVDPVARCKAQLKYPKVGNIECEASGSEKGDFGNNPQMKRRFIEMCLREVNTCGYQKKSLKLGSWDRIKKEIYKEFGVSFKQKDVKNKWDYLRRSYQAWRYLLNRRGNGYDAVTGTFDWPQSVWDDVIREYPTTKRFRNKPLEYANELRLLFDRTLATEDTACGPAREKMPTTDVPHSSSPDAPTNEPERCPIEAPSSDPIMDSDFPVVCFEDIKHLPSTLASEQGSQSDVDTSRASGKRKRKANSEDIDMKAEIRELVAVLKDQMVSEKAKEGPSLEDCTQCMNQLLHESRIDMKFYHGALLKFCECENYRKAFIGMQTLEHRIFFLRTMVGGI